jgi:hypothetical protein
LESIGQGQGFEWKKGELLARCTAYGRHRHHNSNEIDLKNCTCGFYARTSLDSILSYSGFQRDDRINHIYGAIMMYGKVEYGRNVIRSEKCQIVCFITPFAKSSVIAVPGNFTHRCVQPSSHEPSGCPDFIGQIIDNKMICPTCGSTRLLPIGDGGTSAHMLTMYEKMKKVADYLKLPLVFREEHLQYVTEYGEVIRS